MRIEFSIAISAVRKAVNHVLQFPKKIIAK